MEKMATTSAAKLMVLAVLVAIVLLISTEVATAAVDNNAQPELKLGRRLLQAEYNTTGRGAYNSYNTTGRGGYN